MGVHLARVRFDDGAPSEAALREAIVAAGVSDYALDSVRRVDDRSVEICTMFDPYSHLRVLSVVERLGGRPVDHRGQPIAVDLPPHARRRWSQTPWLERARITLRYWARLLRS